jgi:competence ComEA-like helix-hairpin-helix protein
MTPSERKAILFLASLLVLGAGARLAAALHRDDSVGSLPADRSRLSDQIAAVDSERASERVSRMRRARRNGPRRSTRITSSSTTNSQAATRDSVLFIDVDRATAEELEALPRVGPALAKRIVRDREENGPFGSVSGLIRVKGIGPKLVMHVAPHVTFSGSVRPSTALSVSLGSVPSAGRPPPPG